MRKPVKINVKPKVNGYTGFSIHAVHDDGYVRLLGSAESRADATEFIKKLREVPVENIQ